MRLLLITLALFCVAVMFSCEDTLLNDDIAISETQEELNPNVDFYSFAKRANIKFNCTSDSCDDSDATCQVATDMNGRFECTCSGCKMTISSDKLNSDTDYLSLVAKNSSFDLAVNFMKEKHKIDVNGFDFIDVAISDKNSVITYGFEIGNDELETVMYVTEYDSATKRIDKTIEIDCTGDCNCREQYNANTGQASCSCDDCKMTVTTKESSNG